MGFGYICQSPNHRQLNSPLRSGQAPNGGQSSAGARTLIARNFARAVGTRDTVTGPDKDEGTPRALTEAAFTRANMFAHPCMREHVRRTCSHM
jgi:hypothetical protein